ncbi:ParB/RepB/Spo0J family partition protein [Desulfosarcina cetonica]|uniref:ParB/RepB/Spo0J family partition protein n=1 Tax=Desulfosarcina cetonica TaxID=90730 RepID=UPI0006D01891|nr:ParB/RepB/Spo0J family partition protein [Desulfosarcina cetonica]
MDFRITSVSLAEIADTDERFKISTCVDKTGLRASISTMGLLCPPVLMAGEKGYVIVSGFRRIQTIKALGWDDVPARILSADFPLSGCARIAIGDNSFQRSLNIVEQSRAYALIQNYSDPSNDWQDVARMLGLSDSETAMRRLMSVGRLPEILQYSILEGSIALPVALRINALQDDERDVITTFSGKSTPI